MTHKRRRQRLRKLIGTQADALLVTNEANVRYLTGFTGDSSYVVLGARRGAWIVSDPRYTEQIGQECSGLDSLIRKPGELLIPFVARQLRDLTFRSVMFESDSMSVGTLATLKSELGDTEWVEGSGQVEALRAIKDQGEIALLERAADIAQRAFMSFRAQLMPGQTERELAHELERLIRGLGGEGCSFAPIVAAGARAALPHAVPQDVPVGDHPFVLVDWGATFEGYRSDLTRVLLTSKIPAKIARAYEIVLAAQTKAIAAMRPGVRVADVDEIARQAIVDAKLGKYFTHGLGHGIGLDIHEAPRLSQASDQTLEEGMVVTVEPGVYFPGTGGIRIEDDVLVTSEGTRLLTNLPRGLDENRISYFG